MSAKHPITGAPIRILQTGANIWKEHKTLLWLRGGAAANTLYIPFDTVATNTVQYDTKLYIFTEEVPDLVATISKKGDTALFILCKEVFENISKHVEPKNCMILEELYLLYPSLEEPWSGSVAHAVLQIAQVLRYQVLRGFTKDEQIPNQNIQYISDPIPKLWLIQQYYEPKEAKRAREIRHCLTKNLENPWIDKVVLLNEKEYKLPSNPKIHQHVLGHRLMYSDALEAIRDYVPKDTIVAFANADIYLDDTAIKLWSLNLNDKLLALLRYEEDDPPRLFGPRTDSQDCWIVNSQSIQNPNKSWGDFSEFRILFGQSGCDNAFAYEMMRKKFLLTNPAISIQTIHCHRSNIRHYNVKDIVERPIFVYIQPTPIQEFRAEKDLSQFREGEINSEGNSLRPEPIFPNVGAAKTFYKMLRESAKPFSNNSRQPIFHLQNVNQTNSGLLYNYNTLYMGTSEQTQKLWSESKVGSLTPSALCEKAVAVPMEDGLHLKSEEYILFYLSRVLAIRPEGDAVFWGPKDQKILDLFSWPQKVGILPCDEIQQTYCKDVYAILNAPKKVSKSDIKALRSSCDLSDMTPEKKAVLISDDFDAKRLQIIQVTLENAGYDVWILDSSKVDTTYIPKFFAGASLLVTETSSSTLYQRLGYAWLMPPGAKVIEFQSQSSPSLTGAELSEACGHMHYILPSGTTDISSPLRENTVKLPWGQKGLHAHAGDSFRELIGLWASAGYCSVQFTSEPFCSMNGVILYDRPTYKWLDATAPKYATTPMLVGNPPPSKSTQAPWIFWGRHPEVLEKVSQQDLPNKRIGCVFIGNAENSIQKANRSESWSNVCTFWHLGGKQLTQEEYLMKIGSARFALALPGYGHKCHREVEALALGTPLIVTPGVDVINYSTPLVEGTHYISVKTSEEAIKAMAAISDEEWIKMSDACRIWYKQSASVNGSYITTNFAVERMKPTVPQAIQTPSPSKKLKRFIFETMPANS